MKRRHWSLRALALSAALALCVPAAALSEAPEQAQPESPAIDGEEMTIESAWEEAPVEVVEDAPLEAPAEAEGAAIEETAPDAQPAEETAPEGAQPTEETAPEDANPAEDVPGQTGEPSEDPARDGEGGEAAPEDAAVASQEAALEEEIRKARASEPDVRLGVGEQYALDGAALLGGASATFYRSDLPGVAEVDAQTGAVTAVAAGTAVITATGAGGEIGSCVIEVRNAPEALSFEATSLKLGVGESLALPARVPENCAAHQITYASSNKSVASVDSQGNVTARKAGTATIAAQAYNDAKAVCKVKVYKAPSKLTLSPTKLVLSVGQSQGLKAKLPSKTASQITWTSSDPAVVSVDAAGTAQGLSAGKATVTARAFNGKKASCKVVVLDGSAPTSLSLGAQSMTLAVKEKYQLQPTLGEGENAVFAYSSSNPAVAGVSSKGVITAKKKGKAKITVTTHNGLKAVLSVKVAKAPSKVNMSQSEMTLEAGTSAELSAWLPSGTGSSIRWDSSDTKVATVDEKGIVTGVSAGKCVIRARTFNNKKALCNVTVTPAGVAPVVTPEPTPDPTSVPSVSASKMVSNLRASGALGAKRDAIANVIGLMIDAGFEPAFAAGVGANIYSEGTYGMFESSNYVTNYKKRPRYFCYLDGGDYYASGSSKVTAVYMAKEEIADYRGGPEARERFAEKNFYLNNYSRKYVWEVDLTELEALMEKLAEGNWEGKFGLGIVQWTGGRTKKLVACYRKHAGPDATKITQAQAVAAENEMILRDFSGDYRGVYDGWRNDNSDALYTAEAAYNAGAVVCTRYEIPVNKESKAVTRGNKAEEIFNIMVGAD